MHWCKLGKLFSLYLRYNFVAGHMKSLSQMPVVLIPIHFDRDPLSRVPSCQRSVVIRTFITNDFMTGIPATIGKEIPEEVSS
jgi:GMP synthase (glutamine-hydrolysing)